MFSSTFIAFTTVLSLALFTQAAPVPRAIVERGPPAGWAYDWLEDYDVYHTRYLALSCHKQRDTPFFKSCCSPLLKTETLSGRPAYCTAPQASLAAVSSSLVAKTAVKTPAAAPTTTSCAPAAATTTAVVVDSSEDTWCDEEVSTSAPVAQPTIVAAVVPAAPTTTSKAPAPVATVAPSSGGDVQTGGHATYFYQNGNAGACGNYASDSDYVIAVPQKWWGTSSGQASSMCGKKIEITRSSSGAKVTAVVADLCPSCTSDNSLDLSAGAFTAIATKSEGMVDITWKFV